jgi:hypothetical protein
MTEDGGRSNKDFILVFCSDTGIRLLQDAGDIFCDGTFGTVKCCPPFCQIVVLQAKVEDKRALPAAYALLTRKVRICYIRYPVNGYDFAPRVSRVKCFVWKKCDFILSVKFYLFTYAVLV